MTLDRGAMDPIAQDALVRLAVDTVTSHALIVIDGGGLIASWSS